MRPDLTLRAFTAADLPMMADWPATPALRQWWGDPAELLAIVADDLHNPVMDQQIAGLGSVSYGYVRADRRAGFQDIAIRPGEDGDQVLVTQFDPASFW